MRPAQKGSRCLKACLSLSGLEQDALTEVINVGVAKAAAHLRDMVGDEVLLSVPAVTIMTREDAARAISSRGGGRLVTVQQAFVGEISGRALLIFLELKSLEIVRAITGGDFPPEDIGELEVEALAEVGNMVLNGCLASVANMLQRTLRISLPEVSKGDAQEIFSLDDPSPENSVMFLFINFVAKRRDITGYLALLMDMPSLQALKVLLGELIARTA